MTVNKIVQFAIQESYLYDGLGDDVVICKVVKGFGGTRCFCLQNRHQTVTQFSSPKHSFQPTRHSQQTNIHAPGGIRTQDLSRRAAAGRSPAEILL